MVHQKKKKTNQRKTPYSPKPKTNKGGKGVTVAVTNLDSEVTESDVREIFSQVGKVNSAIIHYNAKGKSRGTAMIKFANKHALKAVNEYHQAEVDGRPMYVRAVAIVNTTASPQPRARSKTPKPKKKRFEQSPKRKGAKRGRGRGRGRGKGRKKAKPVTVEQLDKEMDDYHNMTTTAGGVDLVAAGQPVLAE